MPKGRKPDSELLTAADRQEIRQLSGGDGAEYKRLYMQRLRRARADEERRELEQLPLAERPDAPPDLALEAAGQARFTGDDFDPEWPDRDRKDELRRRCQTDIMFLWQVLGRDVTERTHGPLRDFLIKKNPDRHFADQDSVKERNALYPRGSFKTSLITVDDAVQHTICFPETRILFLGGEKKITKAVLDMYTDTFVVKDKPTRFQRLFPEFCINERQRYDDHYEAPCRRNPQGLKEPTAMSNSIDSALSSWHYDVIKAFDLVNNDNWKIESRRKDVIKNFYTNKNLVMRYGYVDNEGTRYHPEDLHAERFAQSSPRMKHICRPAMWTKPTLAAERRVELEARLRNPNVSSSEFRAEDWELLFPEYRTADGRDVGISFEYLMSERGPSLEKFEAFFAQLLNDPIAATGGVAITRDQLRRATIPFAQVPREGPIFLLFDLAYGQSKSANSTAGAVARLDEQGRLIFLELIWGKFVTHELEFAIVDAIRRWSPAACEIEDSMGAKWLTSGLQLQALRMGVPINVSYFPIDKGEAAKDARVRACESPIESGRVLFSSGMEHLEMLYQQLEKWGHSEERDLADAMGLMVQRHLPALPASGYDLVGEEAYEEGRRRELHDFIHGIGAFEPEPEAPPPDPYALEEICPGLSC